MKSNGSGQRPQTLPKTQLQKRKLPQWLEKVMQVGTTNRKAAASPASTERRTTRRTRPRQASAKKLMKPGRKMMASLASSRTMIKLKSKKQPEAPVKEPSLADRIRE